MFTDGNGVSRWTSHFVSGSIGAVVAATNRPQYHKKLKDICGKFQVPFFVLPHQRNHADITVIRDSLNSLGLTYLLCDSYSQLISSMILSEFQGRAYNIHYSLLPKNRGPNPIQWALIHDENETGFSLHKLSDRFDEGAIVYQESVDIEDLDTWVSLTEKVDRLVATFVSTKILSVIAMDPPGETQSDRIATHNKRLDPDYPLIKWREMSERKIFNLIRAQVFPLQGAYFFHLGKKVFLQEYHTLDDVRKLKSRYVQS